MGLSPEANRRLSASASTADKLNKVFAPAPRRITPEQLEDLYDESEITGDDRWHTCCPKADFNVLASRINDFFGVK